MKLTIDVIPYYAFRKSIKYTLPEADWNQLRKEVYKKYDYKCGICNNTKNLKCHEIWSFDDTEQVQQLDGLIVLCMKCRLVKNFRYAQKLASKGKLDLETIINHFMGVNKCSRKEFLIHLKKCINVYTQRSKRLWIVVIPKI